MCDRASKASANASSGLDEDFVALKYQLGMKAMSFAERLRKKWNWWNDVIILGVSQWSSVLLFYSVGRKRTRRCSVPDRDYGRESILCA